MQGFCAGGADSSAAFDALYERYRDKTWRYFRRNFYGAGEEAARDAQQELWMKLIERRHLYRAENRFAGYLFSMAHSVLVDAQRKTMRVVDAGTDTETEPDTLMAHARNEPPRASHLQRAMQALRIAIGQLPVNQRNTFVMYQESGMSYADIAAATNTSTETVKSRLRYARNKLKAELQEELRDVEL